MLLNILIVLEQTDKVIPYEYHPALHGYLSKLLGDNDYGKKTSKFTYSNLCNGICVEGGFKFKSNPYFYIRTDSNEVFQNFAKNINNNRTIFDGLTIVGFDIVNVNLKRKYFTAHASTPLLIQKKFNKVRHLSSEEISECEAYLVESAKHKAKEACFEIDPNLSIEVVNQLDSKSIFYRKIMNVGRNMRLRINCDEKTKEFILLHGLGRSTSCGFGFLI